MRVASSGGAVRQCPTVTLQNLKTLPVSQIAAPNCLLFLWVTNPTTTKPSTSSDPRALGRFRSRGPLAARTMIALSTPLVHQIQRPRNVAASVL